MKPKLFIGSSVESLDVAYAAQENLDHEAEVTVWNQGIFDLSKFTIESLVEILEEFDFALFIFSPDDIIKIRGSNFQSVRDNVVFELGLFIGRIGRERSFIIIPRGVDDLRIPTDLLGITPATFEPSRQDSNIVAALGPACNRVRKAINKLGHLLRPSLPDQVSDQSSITPVNYDDNDYITILESWMGARPRDLNTEIIYFRQVEEELRLPPGTAGKWLPQAARRWHYKIHRKGNQTIVFISEND